MRKCSPISPNSFRKVLIGLGISAGLLSPNYVFATSLDFTINFNTFLHP
ncbi:susC/RagA family TonB-linked outer membrane protein [Bacteroides fragilis CAG:47]|nr:susC/RagA family TonB-linked outer membrane protein [Bacteroides fragilis CAG:47]